MKDKIRAAMKRQREYREMVKSQPVHTWSATMPAYAYTDQCPEPELWRPEEDDETGGNK